MKLEDLNIRTTLQPGDLGRAIEMHGRIYVDEFEFDPLFEFYVAKAMGELKNEFIDQHCFWIAEHQGEMVGFIALMHHESSAQLRFFIIEKAYRGIGLGRKLMDLFFETYHARGYRNCFLWTTNMLLPAIYLYKSYGFELVDTVEANTFNTPLIELKFELKE